MQLAKKGATAVNFLLSATDLAVMTSLSLSFSRVAARVAIVFSCSRFAFSSCIFASSLALAPSGELK